MKKIALIADGWKRLVTYSWVDGIIKQAESLGIDICLYYFSSNGNWSHDKKFNDGEYVIYSLPELDGFVLFYISIIKCAINLALMCRFMVHFYL